MKKIENLENGGIAIISSDGSRVEFDENYKMVLTPVDESAKRKHFALMDSDKRKVVRIWHKMQKAKNEKEEKFMEIVKTALHSVLYDYYIAELEPSLIKENLFYERGNPVCTGFTAKEWEKKARNYAPTLESELANMYELCLWYAYRIAVGFWTLDFVCKVFGQEANNISETMALSGEKDIGAYYDGVRNTPKLVKDLKGGYVVFGGNFRNWKHYAIAGYFPYNEQCEYYNVNCTGVVVLKKIDD